MQTHVPSDQSRYEAGRRAAGLWIEGGGDLNADGPDTDEAYFNGFIDRLAEERSARRSRTPAASTLPST